MHNDLAKEWGFNNKGKFDAEICYFSMGNNIRIASYVTIITKQETGNRANQDPDIIKSLFYRSGST